MSELNPWAAKAQALDRYRWRLLRERHHLIGSAARFLRDAVLDFGFGLLAWGRMTRKITSTPCDFLLLQAAPKVIAFQRKKMLIEGLIARGYRLRETALAPRPNQLRQRLLSKPPFKVPLRYLGYAAHAQWLVEQHNPSILLNDRNGSLYAPFLRLALNARHHILVQLAHATTMERSSRLSMNDYDYYFLFGQGSLDALKSRPLLFGHSTAVLAGSYMIDQQFDMPAADPDLNTLLILGVGPDKEKEAGYQHTYALLRDWAAAHPQVQVRIKSHPRSAGAFWGAAAARLNNVEVLPKDCSLAEALANSSLVVNILSNAVIEAALAKRPILYVNAGSDPDFLKQESFFGLCINNPEALQHRIEHIQQEYLAAVQSSIAFAEYHLAHGCQGLDKVLEHLEQLFHHQTCTGTELPAKGITQ